MDSSFHYHDVFSLQSEPFTVSDAVPLTLPTQSPQLPAPMLPWNPNRSQDITGWMDMTSKIQKGAGVRKEKKKKPRAGSAAFRVPGYGRPPPPPPRRINAPSHKKVSSPNPVSSSPANTVLSGDHYTAAPALTFEKSPIPTTLFSFSVALPSDQIAYPSFDTVDPCFLTCTQPESFDHVLERAVQSSYFIG
ncbi:hypothetical protein BDZ89DRAFT_1061138 [Hymenopellis radicata]|nr:hypothetical protein BDZ89DRAFT_1061138 [Hymenopellis radicata]